MVYAGYGMVGIFILVITALLSAVAASAIVPGGTPGGRFGAVGFGLIGGIVGWILFYVLLQASGGAIPSSGPVALGLLLALGIAATAAILFALRAMRGRSAQA